MNTGYNIIKEIECELFKLKDSFVDFPYLMDDITIKSLYESLISVQSASELKKWMAALEKTKLSAFMKSTCLNNNWIDDCFGVLHTLLMTVKDRQFDDIVFLVKKLKESDFSRYYYKNDVEKYISISNGIHKESQKAVVLFRQKGNKFAAFSNDASMLYTQYGWELSTVKMNRDVGCEFIQVYPRGYEFLCKQDIKVIIKNCDFALDFSVTNRENLNLSNSQQTIDCFRTLIQMDSMVCSSMGLSYYPVIDGLETEEKFPFMFKKGNSLGLYGEKGDSVFIIQDNVWKLEHEQIPLINNLACNLALIMNDEKKLQHFIGNDQIKYDNARSCMIIAEFMKNKALYPGTILLMKSGGLAWSFMEDALELTRLKPRTIWKIGGEPAVFLNSDIQERFVGKRNITIVESELKVSFDELRLSPHDLNIGVRSSILFSNPRIFKTKQGDFAIQAEVDNRTIPMIRIPKNLSDEILRYPEGILRGTIIKYILFNQMNTRYSNMVLA